MQTAHEFFVHELQGMLDAEERLVQALGEQGEESSRPDLQKAFQAHQAQTGKHVERLQQIFALIDAEPSARECKGLKGLIEEHDSFKQEDPSEDLMDTFNVGAATKVERYEISSYETLIRLAEQMGHKKAVKLLNQNLKDEQQTLKKMEAFSKKLKPENMGMSEESEESRTSRSTRGRGRRAA